MCIRKIRAVCQTMVLGFFSFQINPQALGISQPAEDQNSLHIKGFIDTEGETAQIVGAEVRKLLIGSTVYSYRQAPGSATQAAPIWLATGKFKVLEVGEAEALVRYLGPPKQDPKIYFPKYPIPMTGDRVQEVIPHVRKNPVLTPERTVLFAELFRDPNGNPTDFELTSAGEKRLRVLAQEFTKWRLKTLLIEAHTGRDGNSSQNQVESQQRALTIKQFLVDNLGFPHERIIAIGMGEWQPKDTSNTVGEERRNRRIVLRVSHASQT